MSTMSTPSESIPSNRITVSSAFVATSAATTTDPTYPSLLQLQTQRLESDLFFLERDQRLLRSQLAAVTEERDQLLQDYLYHDRTMVDLKYQHDKSLRVSERLHKENAVRVTLLDLLGYRAFSSICVVPTVFWSRAIAVHRTR
uniref:Uncharacterized protein n=1 Tax=Mycena chlorophos TaxID=658473 RepID=A0ABQ0LUK9_MYCCL|nr:predicted protein [Mycena chlorophos]